MKLNRARLRSVIKEELIKFLTEQDKGGEAFQMEPVNIELTSRMPETAEGDLWLASNMHAEEADLAAPELLYDDAFLARSLQKLGDVYLNHFRTLKSKEEVDQSLGRVLDIIVNHLAVSYWRSGTDESLVDTAREMGRQPVRDLQDLEDLMVDTVGDAAEVAKSELDAPAPMSRDLKESRIGRAKLRYRNRSRR